MKSLLIICLFLSSTWLSIAQLQRSDTKQSLRGLNGVYVTTQFIDLQPEGLTTNRVETIVKSILHDAAVPVDAQPLPTHGDANLSITISTIEQKQLGVYLFTVEVAVTQNVQLTRQPNISPLSAETWRRSVQGLTSPNRIDVIELALKKSLNQFVTNYLAVNPKKTDASRLSDQTL